jgi:hypothetical protein
MFARLRTFGGRSGILFLAGALLFFVAPSSRAAVTVTVKERAPMESLSPTGDITGVSDSSVGATYTFVSSAADQVIMRNAQGGNYRIATAATDYVAPSVKAPPVAASAPPATTTNSVAQSTPATTNSAPVSAPSATSSTNTASAPPIPPPASLLPASDDSVASINAGLGKPIFSSTPLWQEAALLLAQRLGLGLEGRTKWDVSYRRYFSGQPEDPKAKMLGTGAYCIAIYADADDHPTSLLIAFANDGDFHGVGQMASDIYALEHPSADDSSEDIGKKKKELIIKYDEMEKSFEPAREDQQKVLIDSLTGLFGEPKQTVFGTDEVTKENTLRWDWNGASFLLTCQPNKYNLLRIVPTELADNNGRTERIPRDDIGKRLSDAVEHRPNGDVVITQIPMADQGPKGYCVPATWERVLRYTGVPGDMYTLSRIGNAGFGGGEQGSEIAQQLDKTLYDYGRHVQVLDLSHLDYIAIRHYIDDGVPIFWGVNVNGYEPALQRYSLCDRDKDWDEWQKLLDQTRQSTPDKQPPLPEIQGHQVLITGYNPDTKEIAWSDPWGRTTQERWMTQEEAQRCSLNEFYIITW